MSSRKILSRRTPDGATVAVEGVLVEAVTETVDGVIGVTVVGLGRLKEMTSKVILISTIVILQLLIQKIKILIRTMATMITALVVEGEQVPRSVARVALLARELMAVVELFTLSMSSAAPALGTAAAAVLLMLSKAF